MKEFSAGIDISEFARFTPCKGFSFTLELIKSIYQNETIIMALTLTVPNDVLAVLKTPHHRLQEQLTQELAFSLYERGLASMGVARRYANLNKWAFLEGLAQRGIKRHYDLEERNEDLAYAGRSE